MSLNTSRISKIFITHMHGDHILGLPALLTDIGVYRNQGKSNTCSPIDIYGPPGLSHYLKTVFQLMDTKSNHPCIIHELYDSKDDVRLSDIDSTDTRLFYSDRRLQVSPLFRSMDGFWSLCNDTMGCVRAGSVHHSIDCFGYVYQMPLSGLIDEERLSVLLSDYQSLLESYGIPNEMVLRRLQMDGSMRLPSGLIVNAIDVMKTTVIGKRLVILGDTDDANGMQSLIQGCDVMIHESTVIPLMKEYKGRTKEEMEAMVKRGGHSTTAMASRFAKEMKAKKLILTHLSCRYPVSSVKYDSPALQEMRKIAEESFGSKDVVIASDFMRVDLLFVCFMNKETRKKD